MVCGAWQTKYFNPALPRNSPAEASKTSQWIVSCSNQLIAKTKEPSIMPDRISQNLIAPCGMNCGVCRAYLRKNNPCYGCRDTTQDKPKSIVQCRMRNCKMRSGKFCFDCPEFPCERLRNLNKRYRTKYVMSEIENLESIRENGIRNFVAAERKRWISEKGIFCVHSKQYYK
jgi:hypothetical protein